MLGFGALTGVVLSAYSYTGGLRGEQAHEERDEVERKWEEMHKYRSSMDETIEEIGEGRGKLFFAQMEYIKLISVGIYGPGYKERRRARLLAKYGIDVGAAEEAAKSASK